METYSNEEASDYSEDEASPESNLLSSVAGEHQSFVLGYQSADVDLSRLQPLPSQIPYIWQVYQENVEPLIKVIHVPTVERVFRGFRANPSDLTAPNEALLFSIYYAAITSLEPDEVCAVGK
jgi:hypothetical protein